MLGKLISFEGGDGSGKSSVTQHLRGRLEDQGVVAMLVNPKRPTFDDPYVSQHMSALSRILWERDASEPRNLLNDYHWVYLSSAWFQIVDQHLMRPALNDNQIVIADSWYHKLLTRFSLKGVEFSQEAARCYSGLTRPDLTFLLDVDPVVAANRKTKFGYAETGNFDGLEGATRENFVLYQTRVRFLLKAMAETEGWETIQVDNIDPQTTLDQILEILQNQRLL
jgi:thymidylate kinase